MVVAPEPVEFSGARRRLGFGLVLSLGAPMTLVGARFPWATLAPTKGTTLRHPFDGFAFGLPWPEVVGVRVERFKGARGVARVAPDPRKDIDAANEFGREARRKRPAAVGSRFVVPGGLFRATPERVARTVERFRRAYAPPGAEGRRAP